MSDMEDIKNLSIWMIKTVCNQPAMVKEGVDWDWVAAEAWHSYPGILNEFLINDAIDFIFEAAEYEQ